MTPLHIALGSVLGIALVASVATDLLYRRILDWVSYPALALALGARCVFSGVGDSTHGLLSGCLGALIAFAPFAYLSLRKRMGWGDAKLMAAAGAVFGYPAVWAVLIFVSLVGALEAIVALLWNGALWETVSGFGGRIAEKLRLRARGEGADARRHIPYALAIALGCLWAVWWETSSVR